MHLPGANKSGERGAQIGKTERRSRRFDPELHKAMVGEEKVFKDNPVRAAHARFNHFL